MSDTLFDVLRAEAIITSDMKQKYTVATHALVFFPEYNTVARHNPYIASCDDCCLYAGDLAWACKLVQCGYELVSVNDVALI